MYVLNELYMGHLVNSRMMEESRVISDDNYDYDSFDEQSNESERPAERWAPLGAAADPKPTTGVTEQRQVHCARFRALTLNYLIPHSLLRFFALCVLDILWICIDRGLSFAP